VDDVFPITRSGWGRVRLSRRESVRLRAMPVACLPWSWIN